jgi:hypothetical protein
MFSEVDMRNRRHVTAFLSGFVFAIGLGVAGMTQPAKVLAFLDVFGAWDPSLALVMAGAMAVYALLYRLALRLEAPMFGGVLQLPTRTDLNPRLVGGAALFGVGWGVSGFCPGPAITSVVSGNGSVLLFMVFMTAGMYLHSVMEALSARRGYMAGAVR